MQEPTPEQKQQIQANVAAMRAAGKPETLVQEYLEYEAGALTSSAVPAARMRLPSGGLASADATRVADTHQAAPWAEGQAQPQEQESRTKGFLRSVLQHGMFNFGDEAGLVDQAKQDRFATDHKILDFLATIGGGAAAPLVATLAAPELATVGGGIMLSGLAGLFSGAGDQDQNDQSPGQMDSRTDNALGGAAGGVVGGAAGSLVGAAASGAVKGAVQSVKGVVSGDVGEAVKGLLHLSTLGHSRLGAKAITKVLTKTLVKGGKAVPADFTLTPQFGGATHSLFGKAPVAAPFPATQATGGIVGGQVGGQAKSLFNEPDQQY